MDALQAIPCTLAEDPFSEPGWTGFAWDRPRWAARWIHPPAAPDRAWGIHEPVVFQARLEVELAAPVRCRIHVAADEHYRLAIDGCEALASWERGPLAAWPFESADLVLPAGAHALEVEVSHAGALAGMAQPSWRAGFILDAEGPAGALLRTGTAPWRERILPRERFVRRDCLFYAPPRSAWDLAVPPGPWGPPAVGEPGRGPAFFDQGPGPCLVPAVLPPPRTTALALGAVRWAQAWPAGPGDHGGRLDACDPGLVAAAAGLCAGGAWTVAPGRSLVVVIDLQDYAFPDLAFTVAGGAGSLIHLGAAESAYDRLPADGGPGDKGRRDDLAGKHLLTGDDAWRCDGNRHRLRSRHPHAGRYLRLAVRTADRELVISDLTATVRAPAPPSGGVAHTGSPGLDGVLAACTRTLLLHAQDTYIDSPYYERLMYVGDARIESLVWRVLGGDPALPARCLRLFAGTRGPDGLLASRVPSRSHHASPATACCGSPGCTSIGGGMRTPGPRPGSCPWCVASWMPSSPGRGGTVW